MFDIWLGDINLTWMVIIFAIAVILPIQILLCFKVKSLILRLLPVILSVLLILTSVIMYFSATGWDGLVYVFFAIYGAGLMLVSAVGWGIWKIADRRKIKR